MVAELRIGIIGLGARSAIAANLARTGLGARLVGGADPDPQMRARAARAFGEHLAWVEDYWFGRRLLDRPMPRPWSGVDWDADPDWDWRLADDAVPQDLHELWAQAKDRSRAAVSEAISLGGLDFLARVPWPDGTTPSLRWILVHMIEEYARHNGHADLLRESIDGLTGE